MLPYYLLVIIPLLLSVPEYLSPPTRRRRRWGRVPVVFFFFGLFLLLSLRDRSIGVDTARYAYHFEQVRTLGWGEIWAYHGGEGAFFFLCKLVATLGGDYRTLLVVVALICTLPTALFYMTRTLSPSLTLAMYPVLPVFMMSFSGLRQAIAVALAVPVFCAATRKHWMRACLWIAVAFCFHRSAAVLILFLPATHIRLSVRHLPALAVLYALAYAARRPLFSVCLRLLGESERVEEMTDTGGMGMLLLFAGCLLIAFLIPSPRALNRESHAMRTLLCVAVFIQLFSSVHPLSMRLNYYFILFIPPLMGRVLRMRGRLTPSLAAGARLCMVVFFVIFYAARIMVSDSLGIYPYRPFWG